MENIFNSNIYLIPICFAVYKDPEIHLKTKFYDPNCNFLQLLITCYDCDYIHLLTFTQLINNYPKKLN